MGIKCCTGHHSYFNEPPKEFICDTDADFENLPKACTGSTAVSIQSGKIKVVNTSGEWVFFAENK